MALRWSAAWWWAPPTTLTLRRFPPCGPRLVILGLFSTEKGLSFSGLDPSFVSSDTEGPPPPPSPGCSSHGGLVLRLRGACRLQDCDTLDAPCLRIAISGKMHISIPDVCVCVLYGGLMEGFIPNCRTSASETNRYNNNEPIYSAKEVPLHK